MSLRNFGILVALVLILSACSTSRREVLPSESYIVASWYGQEFQGRPTSSGETFDMYKKTCAHKEYAFGTILRVTNQVNSRSVECVVNDRGPFVDGRDLDLSYAAAKEIGVIGPGTCKVFVQVRGRDDSYIRTARVRTTKSGGPFAIQVGSFSEHDNAERLKTALSLKYKNAYIREAEVKKALYYRVRIGNFGTFGTALSTAGKLGEEGYQPIVVKANSSD